MLAVDLPLRTRSGGVERLTDAGRAGQLGLPRVADALYESARRLRVFTDGRASARLEGLMGLVRTAGRRGDRAGSRRRCRCFADYSCRIASTGESRAARSAG